MDKKQAEKYVGAYATISKDSRFAHQIKSTESGLGIVEKIKVIKGETWFAVQFPNGYDNDYNFEDLVFSNPFENNKNAASLLSKSESIL